MTLHNTLKEGRCDCCGWDDYGYQHEPTCTLLTYLNQANQTDV